MEGFVSQRWTGAAAFAVSLSVVWLVFLYGSPWMGLTWVVSVAFAAALWASLRDTRASRPIGQVIAETEPVPAIATMRAVTRAPKAVH